MLSRPIPIERNKKGQFVKGVRSNSNGEFRKGHKVNLGRKRPDLVGHKWNVGRIPPNKGTHIQTNTGRTHFKNGHTPHNYKGGISKTREYRNFYNRRREAKKKGAIGSFTFGEWKNLKAQYNWTCPSCRRSEPDIKLTQDHVVPISKGGSNNIENIQPLCGSCNSQKYTEVIKYGTE